MNMSNQGSDVTTPSPFYPDQVKYKLDIEKIYDENNFLIVSRLVRHKNIDLIIGGHTHTLLDKPTEIKNIVKKSFFGPLTPAGSCLAGRGAIRSY